MLCGVEMGVSAGAALGDGSAAGAPQAVSRIRASSSGIGRFIFSLLFDVRNLQARFSGL